MIRITIPRKTTVEIQPWIQSRFTEIEVGICNSGVLKFITEEYPSGLHYFGKEDYSKINDFLEHHFPNLTPDEVALIVTFLQGEGHVSTENGGK